MRILFVENRYATVLWEIAAEALASAGHEIHWLVQNHAFAPRLPRVHRVPYPGAADLSDAPLPPALANIARSDRGQLHFGGDARHYAFYQRNVDRVIDEVRPDLVFGEPTQFHELMVIGRCRALGIPYLAPTETRYPSGRLVFLEYDSFVPVGGGGQQLDGSALEDMVDAVVQRRSVPAYMLPPASGLRHRAIRLLKQARIAKAWFDGERYCTPSPRRRLQLDRSRDRTQLAWDAVAAGRHPDLGDRWVLYPLQLQPESNLDVFGQPWIDQREIVERAAGALQRMGAKLAVKPNPKSKYEMNPALVETVRRLPNVVALPHRLPMREVFGPAPVVLSATGTVIIESIFAGKPVAVLGDHHMARWPGATPVSSPEGAAELLQSTLDGTARRASREEALRTAAWLHSTSYEARLWDPVSYPQLLDDPGVLQGLQQAFLQVLPHVRTRPARPTP